MTWLVVVSGEVEMGSERRSHLMVPFIVAMPRPKWIGSFSAKTIALDRDDIRIVSVDSNNPIRKPRYKFLS